MQIKAFRIHETGGPEVLRWETLDLPAPGPGEIVVRHTAIGFNLLDTYHRRGRYPLPLPSGIGAEAAGVVAEIGPDVTELRVGQRVAHINPIGAYAEAQTVPAARAIPLPDDIDDRTAAAGTLKGLTAHYLLHRTYAVKPGDVILIHAAAGGVGLLVCQWAKALGATVIGTVSSREKAALALQYGCDHPVVTREEDFVARVKEVTGGQGVHVVYDSVGKDTWDQSMACLRRLGMMVSFGSASGLPAPIDLAQPIYAQGSPFFTRASLAFYTVTREELTTGAAAVYDAVRTGKLRVRIGREYPLQDAPRCHADAEARLTTGSTLLVP